MDTFSQQAAIGSQPSKSYNPLPPVYIRRQNLASAHYKVKANARSDINVNRFVGTLTPMHNSYADVVRSTDGRVVSQPN